MKIMERRFIPIALFSLSLAAAIVGGSLWMSRNREIALQQERFLGTVAGESTERQEPVIAERRDASSEFRPLRKDGVGYYTVPTAHAAVILDAATGISLLEQDADEHRAIASITKLMTTMIAVEETDDLDDPVTISETAVYAEGTRVGCPRSGFCNGERLHVGERISVRNLLKAALMNSANDAAIALAEHVSGSQEEFVKLMNRRSQELGLANTRFCTASGLELDDEVAESKCHSSARDVAKIAAYALRYDILWTTMRTEKTFISSVDGRYEHEIFNTDRLLGYTNLLGTKTGFTPRAGYSLLAVAGDPGKGEHRLIAVVLDDSSRWQSIQDMFSWGFGSYEWL